MSRFVEDVLILDYSGPQGNVELEQVESATVNRTKSKTRVKTMNRRRAALAFQTGTEEVEISLTVVPELVDPEVNWISAWKNDEEFLLVGERGLNGTRETYRDCQISSCNNTYNENGEARLEVSVMALTSREQL